MLLRTALLLALSTASVALHAQEFQFDAALADDILPVGRQALQAETRMGVSNDYFDAQGQKRALFANFDNLPLNSFFPALPGINLGATKLRSKLTGQRVNITYGYGFSDNLTAGFMLGWGRLTNQIDFSVAGASISDATQIVQAILASSSYGYKPVASVTTEGPLDPHIGFRWRVARGENWSTIIVPAIRIGIANKDDPDNLVDVHLTDGSSALMLAAEQRYRRGQAEMRAYGQYTQPLADKLRARPYAAGSLPLVAQAHTETLERKVGGMWRMELEGAYRTGNWRAMSRLEYTHTLATRYSSPSGQAVSGLEANTDGYDLVARLGLSWNGIHDYLAEKAGLPIILALDYSTMLKARNEIKSDNVYLTATLPF